MEFVLGLDVSTSCTGWCVLHLDGSLAEMGGILLGKHKSVYKKAQVVEESLVELNSRYNITRIFIEENLQSFRRGFSSAQTLSTLARFNGIVSIISYQLTGVEPTHLNVNAARKTLGIKLISKKKGGAPTKEQVLDWASLTLSSGGCEYSWPTKILKSGPRKGKKILDPSAFDMADAYVIASAGCHKFQS